MLTRRVRSGHWGVIVVSLTRGDTLYEVNADQPLQPASTMKLFTSALALERFGPGLPVQRPMSCAMAPSTPPARVNGNLILRGDGDPSLSNRFLRGEPDAPMQIAGALR